MEKCQQNDLDLDLFCNEIIQTNIKQLRVIPCLNTYPQQKNLSPSKNLAGASEGSNDNHCVFGTIL